MLSVSLGPLALPVAPLLLIGSVWAASWLATRLAERSADADDRAARGTQAGHAIVVAAIVGLLVARVVHLALQADLYAAAPWSALDLRDGGLQPVAGLVGAAAWLLWRGHRQPVLRQPLALGAVAGLALWSSATLVTGEDAASNLPRVVVAPLEGGAPLDLGDAARGRPVVVNLWASWCGPCRREMPLLAAAQQRETGVGFLFVNQGEAPGTVRAYLAAEGLALREVLLDPASALGPAVGSPGLPTTLFYDAQGRRVDAHVGAISGPALERRLRRLRGTP